MNVSLRNRALEEDPLGFGSVSLGPRRELKTSVKKRKYRPGVFVLVKDKWIVYFRFKVEKYLILCRRKIVESPSDNVVKSHVSFLINLGSFGSLVNLT